MPKSSQHNQMDFTCFLAEEKTEDNFLGGLRIYIARIQSIQELRESLHFLHKKMRSSAALRNKILEILTEKTAEVMKKLIYPPTPRDSYNHKGVSYLIDALEKASIEFIDIAIAAVKLLFGNGPKKVGPEISEQNKAGLLSEVSKIKDRKHDGLLGELTSQLESLKQEKKQKVTKQKKGICLEHTLFAIKNCRLEGVSEGLHAISELHALTHTQENGPKFIDKRRGSWTRQTKTRQVINEAFAHRLLEYLTVNEIADYLHSTENTTLFLSLLKNKQYQFLFTTFINSLKGNPEISILRRHTQWKILEARDLWLTEHSTTEPTPEQELVGTQEDIQIGLRK